MAREDRLSLQQPHPLNFNPSTLLVGGRARIVEPIEPRRIWWRKFATFVTVLLNKRWRPLKQDEFLRRVSKLQRTGVKSSDIAEKTLALWKIEVLGFVLAKHGEPGATLNDPRIPIEVQPVSHVGMGAGAAEVARFESAKTREQIKSLCHPDFEMFAYEPLGGMLAAYETNLRWVGRTLFSLARLEHPSPEDFVNSFEPEIRRLISHGYGRLLFFMRRNIRSAIQAALERDFIEQAASVQATSFAYAIVNHRDLYRVLATGDHLPGPEHAQSFRNGLIYALTFWEWLFPGFLESLRPKASRPRNLIEAAKDEISENRRAGVLKPFALRTSSPQR